MRRLTILAAIATLSCSLPATAEELAGSEKAFTYKATPQGKLSIHVHFPEDWNASDERPAIVFFFGGGWRSGTVEQFRPQAEYLASRGMVAARADYRVKSRHNVTPDKCVEDCKSAVRWLRAKADALGIDPDRIVASGGSAGGHTAATTAIIDGFEAEGDNKHISSQPNLLVLYNPALDTAKLGDRFDFGEVAKQVSPNHHLDSAVPPAIIYFGTNDRMTSMGEDYVKKAKEHGVEAELYLAEGAGHGFFNRSPWLERTTYLTDKFLARHGYLDGEPTIEPPKKAEMKLADSSTKE